MGGLVHCAGHRIVVTTRAVISENLLMGMTYIAKPPLPRDEIPLFTRTLGESISDDHAVRVLDELVDMCDVSEFEATYHGSRGQPPYSPRTLVKIWLYAFTRGINSGRRLAYALKYHTDFMWLASGHEIGHVTLSNFRTEFADTLKSLHRQLCQIAIQAGILKINRITFDGTRVKGNNSRRETLTGAALDKRIAELDAEIAAYLAACGANDDSETAEESASVPPELADKQARQKALQEARDAVGQMDADRRRRQGKAAEKTPAQIPMTDPDSRLMPNKEGGIAPNYTPTTCVDVESGLIVAMDVLAEVNEHGALCDHLRQIEADFGVKVEAVLTDGLNCTGPNIAALEASSTQLYSPAVEPVGAGPNPAERPDPTQPVPESQWEQLPRNSQGKLDRSCFTYDSEQDLYYCPMGQTLEYEKTKQREVGGETLDVRSYRSQACEGCPLAGSCVSKQSKGGRTIGRDEHTPDRERHAKHMARPEAQEVYKERLHAGEVPFAYIKHVIGLRQFLLRGLGRVRIEWNWACIAFNVMKLSKRIAEMRTGCVPAVATEA